MTMFPDPGRTALLEMPTGDRLVVDIPCAPVADVAGLLGVLGGMGPLATVHFFRKIVEETFAADDQSHVPVIINSTPDIPCRTAAIIDGGASPLPQMLSGLSRLRMSRVECVVIPCNTAHYWYEQLSLLGGLPILHIVDAVNEVLEKGGLKQSRVGLLATEGTLAARIYHDRLRLPEREIIVNTVADRERWVVAAIALVKQGRPREAGVLVEQAIARLADAGVDTVILGCTELPVALDSINSRFLDQCIDSTRALAHASVKWHQKQRFAAIAAAR